MAIFFYILCKKKRGGNYRYVLIQVNFWILSKTSWASPSLSKAMVTIKKSRHRMVKGYLPDCKEGGFLSTVWIIG